MRLLALRELRRQAPAAAGMFGLGVLILLLMFASTLVFEVQRESGYLEAIFLVVAVGTPWLLSVTAVAPDQETGAEAFLVTMPVGRGRLALMRSGVALGLSLLVIGVTGALCLLAQPLFESHLMGGMDAERKLQMSIGGLAAGGLMFTAGALATVLVRQTLVAFVISPALVFGPGVLFAWTSDELLRVPDKVTIPVLAVSLPVLLLAAAWRGYVRPTRELGWRRPTRFVAGLTAALFVVGAGLTTTAFAVDRLVPTHRPRSTTYAPNYAAAAVTVEAQTRLRWRGHGARGERTFVFRAGSLGQPLELPAEDYPIAFSPRARSLLLGHRSTNASLTLVNVETGARVTGARPPVLSPAWPRWSKRESLSIGGLGGLGTAAGPVPVVWHEGTPWLAGAQGLVRWDGAEQRRGPADARVIAAGGQRALFQDPRGQVHVLDLGQKTPTRLSPPAGTRPLEWRLLGLDGQWALTLARTPDGACSLWVRDLERAAAWRKVGLTFPESAVFGVGEMRIRGRLISPPIVYVSVSSTSPFASLSVTISRLPHGTPERLPLRTVDLRSGETKLVPGPSSSGFDRHLWLPDGRLLTSHGTWNPAQGRLIPSPLNLDQLAHGYRRLLLFDGHEAVCLWKRIDLKTGGERPSSKLRELGIW